MARHSRVLISISPPLASFDDRDLARARTRVLRSAQFQFWDIYLSVFGPLEVRPWLRDSLTHPTPLRPEHSAPRATPVC